MSAKKRQYQSDSEESFMDDDNGFYNEAILDPIDVNDVSVYGDDESENNDPLGCDIDSTIGEDDKLCSDEKNWELDFESDYDPFASDDENFESDFETDSEDSDLDGSGEDESGSDTDEVEPLRSKECLEEVVWNKVSPKFVPRKKIPTYKETQMSVDKDSTPVDLFFKLFPKRLFEWIARCTNERLDILAEEEGEIHEHTDANEIILVIGCLLVMGYNRLPHMRMYWCNKASLGNKVIKNAIARDRFLLLASKLYFNHPKKPKGASKTYYLDKLIKCLKYTFKRARSEATFQSIDETMILFKGRWAGKQFMPKKKIKRGVKCWTRSDAMTGFCYDFDVYTGKEEGATEGTLGERVVIKLCSTIRGENVVICTDRFFTSYQLMKTLPFACVGTCMSNRKNVPKVTQKLKKGESVSKSTSDGVIGFKWQDTKEVLLLSNCHDGKVTTVERKQKDGTRKSVPCPEAISFYNQYMGGVDMTDQYTVLYDINRKSNKWWNRVFQRLLMTAVTNAWVMHKQLKNKKTRLIDMLVPLAEALIEIGKSGSKIQRSSKNGRPSKKSKLFVNAQHLPAPCTKRRCTLCSSKNIQKRTKFVCSTCDIPLCAGCFLPYHQ